jgi:hypothetical protein
VTASEFTFLALGLILGVVGGASFIEVLRARPAASREVRVTVSTDAIPRRRGSTLADDAFATAVPEPARGGPADRRMMDVPMTVQEIDRRTTVRSGVPTFTIAPDAPAAGPLPGRILQPTFPLADPPISRRPPGRDDPTPIGHGGDDPILAALLRNAFSADMRRKPVDEPAVSGWSGPARMTLGAVATLERPIALAASPDDATPLDATATAVGADPVAADTCGAERRIAAERCGLAVRARAGATEAADAVRSAQRAYDDLMRQADAANLIADPRAMRAEKEAAQARFRMTYDGSRTTDDAEAAARDWLVEINEINTAARTAQATVKRERAAAAVVATTLERLALEGDAARIAAETAEAACLAARQALAECDERSIVGATPPSPPPPAAWADHAMPSEDAGDDEPLAAALSGGGTPMIFRLVRGDRAALIALIEHLGGQDTAARRRWQQSLSGLVDAIIAVSIEAGALHFPAGHHFWGAYTEIQDREISQALSSLGHRFDGLGGFVDDRVPSQRDLSLALGYAGIDPMRTRQWPTETEMAALYHDVTVAADEHLAATAGELSLAELVALLGRRADPLAELWNEWGRVRSLLLEGA